MHHEPTPRRRQLARQAGQVPRSRVLVSALVLLAGLFALWMLGGNAAEQLRGFAERQLGGGPALGADADFAVERSHDLLLTMAAALLPVLGLIAAVAAAANLLQVGLLFLPQRLVPDFQRVSPAAGARRIFSAHNFVGLGLTTLQLLAVLAVAGANLWGRREELVSLVNRDASGILDFAGESVLMVCLEVSAALLLLGLLDYAWQRRRHEQDLRMTDREIREEQREQQPAPQVVAGRRAARRTRGNLGPSRERLGELDYELGREDLRRGSLLLGTRRPKM